RPCARPQAALAGVQQDRCGQRRRRAHRQSSARVALAPAVVQSLGAHRPGMHGARPCRGARAREEEMIADAKVLVVKVGSSLVTREGRGVDAEAIARWAAQVATLRQGGKSVVLVSSGAIAEGMQRLGWAKRPHSMHELQAAAAVGQMGLVQAYESSFRSHGLHTAQVLLTHADLADRQRYLNA